MSHPKIARIRVAGPDHKGIIAAVTGYLSQNNINIEDIDQRILEGVLVMNMVVDFKEMRTPLPHFLKGLREVARKIRMEISFHPEKEKKLKEIAILATKEPHCLEELLRQMKRGEIKGKPVMVLSNRTDLRPIAARYHVPFYYNPSLRKKEHEEKILKKLAGFDVDGIILARYMQILSPEFCFRYEGKIINVHPSLLPSFPGARAYSQAYHKGVEVTGVTAHFVTTDLDEGPIICQEAFRFDKTKTPLEEIIERGKKLEAKTLARAVKLFCNNRLVLRRGKVIDNRKLRELTEKTKGFYR
ncbi:MAG: formyltetrahydrofolate deformylase [Deltaproteobacteria bacterium]|nr:formyltetrahydrofolate deformylase [Deltaproteobacteria bacterium]